VPVEDRIDHERRLVIARAWGTLTYLEMIEYQRRVWSRSDVNGYDELIDVTDVETFERPSPGVVASIAKLAASMDAAGPPAKLAVLAPGDLGYGLARQYQVLRMAEGSTKTIAVFRTRDEAEAFLCPASLPADRDRPEHAVDVVR
jgi:hypothetical protein